MSNRTCTNCNCPCLLISVGCLVSQLNPFSNSTDPELLKAAIDAATTQYILPVIGQDCITALCEALDKSELPTADEDYEALSEAYQQLLDTYVKRLISEAATALYIDSYGFNRLSINLEEFPEQKEAYINRRLASALALKREMQDWLEQEEVKILFACLPTEETETCVNTIDSIGISTPFGDFAASTKFPLSHSS